MPVTRDLYADELEGIRYATTWVNDILGRGFESEIRLTGTRADIPTLHSLISAGPYSDDAESELILFGTVFGEILAHELSMRWVVYCDEEGSEFALKFQDQDVFAFPRDMIIKRVEAGEQADAINLNLLLDEVSRSVRESSRSIDMG